MSPIIRKGSQHSYMVQVPGGWKKCVLPLSCWDIQPASQDCTGKALDSVEYRNTGWHPILKEGKVIKMRKCKANWGIVFLNHLPFSNPAAITSFWMISFYHVNCSPCEWDRMMVLPHHSVSFSSVALFACYKATESSLWVSMGAACPSTVTVPF